MKKNNDKSVYNKEELDKDRSGLPRGQYYKAKMGTLPSEKNKIASYIVSEYIKDFDAVILDSGTTAELIAEEMFARRRFLSVLTNNMGAYASYTRAQAITKEGESDKGASSLHGNELLITGGRYVDVYEALLGGDTAKSMAQFTSNITIIAISGLRCDEGVFCHGEEEAVVKKILWEKPTDIRVIAADWSKIGKRDAHIFGPLKNFKNDAKKAVVVTCNPPDSIKTERREEFEEEISEMKRLNIEIVRLDVAEK
ncbi:Bacterial regulatory protein, DeoR domain protein [Candidatus Magnetomoraceae bacterium gMMP-1]